MHSNHDDADERPHMRLDALTEIMAHMSAIRGIMLPLVLLEEQRAYQERRRAAQRAHKNAASADTEAA